MVSNETPGNATSPPVRTTLVRQTPTEEPSRGGEERGHPTLVESPPGGGEERRATFLSSGQVTSNPINVKRPRDIRDELAELTDVSEVDFNQDGPLAAKMSRPSAPVESPPRRNSEDPASFSLPHARHARPGLAYDYRLYPPRPASQGDSAILRHLTPEALQFFLEWRAESTCGQYMAPPPYVD